MTAPAYSKIISSVKTALETIVTDTGLTWQTTIAPTVSTLATSGVNPPIKPYISFQRIHEDYPDRTTGSASVNRYLKAMEIDLAYWLESWGPAAAVNNGAALADMEQALRDWTLGGACNDLRFIGNDAFATEGADPACGVRATIRITYRISDADPTTRV